MIFYIDYLDHITSGNSNYSIKDLANRLRFDLLIFSDDTLCMSVPACIKLRSTTELLIQLDDFWKNNRIRLQLDDKHKGNPANYFNNRKKVLARNMPEQHLLNHFEFIAYQDARTENFYGIYLPQMVGINSSVYIGKEKDTDALFRENAIGYFSRSYDDICAHLNFSKHVNYTNIVIEIEKQAQDTQSLFQRSLLEETITEKFAPNPFEKQAVATLLDRAFAKANADTSGAYPLTLVLNQLTGRHLIKLLSQTYNELYFEICNLSWHEIFLLSQNDDWKAFIRLINAYIYVTQNMVLKNEKIPLDSLIKSFSYSASLYKLLCHVKNEAIDSAKRKLFEAGLFSEAQNIDLMLETYFDCCSGNFKLLYDIMECIDYVVQRIYNSILKSKTMKRLDYYSKQQRDKKIDILE